jgi:hypothetical protein
MEIVLVVFAVIAYIVVLTFIIKDHRADNRRYQEARMKGIPTMVRPHTRRKRRRKGAR